MTAAEKEAVVSAEGTGAVVAAGVTVARRWQTTVAMVWAGNSGRIRQ